MSKAIDNKAKSVANTVSKAWEGAQTLRRILAKQAQGSKDPDGIYRAWGMAIELWLMEEFSSMPTKPRNEDEAAAIIDDAMRSLSQYSTKPQIVTSTNRHLQGPVS